MGLSLPKTRLVNTQLVFSFKDSAVGATEDPVLADHHIMGGKLHLLNRGPHSYWPGTGSHRALSNFLVLQSAGNAHCKLLPSSCGKGLISAASCG